MTSNQQLHLRPHQVSITAPRRRAKVRQPARRQHQLAGIQIYPERKSGKGNLLLFNHIWSFK